MGKPMLSNKGTRMGKREDGGGVVDFRQEDIGGRRKRRFKHNWGKGTKSSRRKAGEGAVEGDKRRADRSRISSNTAGCLYLEYRRFHQIGLLKEGGSTSNWPTFGGKDDAMVRETRFEREPLRKKT